MMMSNKPHILVVDDDRDIRNLLMRYLTDEGFRVTPAADGRGLLSVLKAGRFDLIVLDLLLPGGHGLDLCRQLRQEVKIPILMLTSLSGETDRILGLELGADDYLTKPFNPRELLARIKAILRRVGIARDDYDEPLAYSFNNWNLDIGTRRLRSPEGKVFPLPAGQFDVLIAFARRPQRVLSRDQLLEMTKGNSTGMLFGRNIDVHVSRLRKKLENDPSEPELIKTIRSAGYIFTPEVQVLLAAI